MNSAGLPRRTQIFSLTCAHYSSAGLRRWSRSQGTRVMRLIATRSSRDSVEPKPQRCELSNPIGTPREVSRKRRRRRCAILWTNSKNPSQAKPQNQSPSEKQGDVADAEQSEQRLVCQDWKSRVRGCRLPHRAHRTQGGWHSDHWHSPGICIRHDCVEH
jgi:hypothetical protein